MSALLDRRKPHADWRPRLLAVQFLAAQALVAAVALVINVLTARALGPAGRGQVAQFLQLGYVASALAVAGIDRAYPVFAGDRPLPVAIREVGRLVAPGIAVVTVGCLSIWAMLAARGTATAASVAALCLLVVGNVAMAGLRTSAAAVSRGVVFLASASAAQVFLLVAAVGLAVGRVDGPAWWLLAYGASLLVPVAPAWWGASRGRGRVRRDLSRVRRAGLILLAPSLATMLLLRSDRLLLPVLGSYRQLGVYVVVATLCEVAVWPAQAWLDTHVALWARTPPPARARLRLYAAVSGYAIGAGVALLAVCHLLVVPVFGPEYRAAAGLALPLVAASACFAVGRTGVAFLLAAGDTRRVLVVEVGAAAVGMAAYIILIPAWGAGGAAVGSLAGYGTCAVMATALQPSRRRTATPARTGRTERHG